MGVATLLAMVSCWAHAPCSREKGQFTRNDGKRVSISLDCSDGLLGPDPCSLGIRLEDGTPLTRVGEVTDDLEVRVVRERAELYWFASIWIPIAGKVNIFDGYQLTEMAFPGKRLSSFWVHLEAHGFQYLVFLVALTTLVAGWRWSRAIPRRGWSVVVYAAVTAGLICATGLYLLAILAAHLSPPLLLAFSSLGWLGLRLFRRPVAPAMHD